MHLANPKYLFFLIFVPIYLVLVYFKRNKQKSISISVFNDLKTASRKFGFKFFRIIRHTLVVLLIILWSIALARPQGAHEKQEVGKNGIDIIIAIDVSDSMRAEDLKPNRIEAAKASLQQFIDGLEDDRLGIIVFAGQAFTQSPLTFDYNILTEYIKNISTDSINKNVNGLSGTAIGDAMLSAVNRFKDSGDRSKVLVVITDGDANTGADPSLAAKKVKEDGIKLYMVGVGRKGGAPLPVNNFGVKSYAKNRDGTTYMATFNEKSLKKVTEAGGGKYFRAGDNKSFSEAMKEINGLEKKEVKMNVTTEYSENFMPFLLFSGLIFFFYLYILAYKTEVK